MTRYGPIIEVLDPSFFKVDGKLYYVDRNGEAIGPLDASTPTCGEPIDGEGIPL